MKKLHDKTALLAVSLFFLLTACDNTGRNYNMPKGEIKSAENGMTYLMTCLEGKKFIATRSAYNYWGLAGPIGDCN